jgi:Zn-dependent protease/CBS domain-containing protein
MLRRGRSFGVGRVLGFRVKIDFSWFIIFFLILWSFTEAVFPAQVRGLTRPAYALMGFAGTALFFLSLLAHELSHAVAARAKGIPVEGITLFIFGGVAQTKMEAARPRDEFIIAGVGPLMSLVLGVLMFGGAWLLGSVDAVGTAAAASAAVLGYIGFLNILLAVFNLLPGFPLDGGRLLRALVWKFTGDLTKATRIASTGGTWLGWLLIGFGAWATFRGDMLGGLWLVFIGWFLRNAARSSYKQHLIRGVLDDASARQTMSPVPVTVPAEITLDELVEEYFMRRRFQAYPVESGGVPIGIVTMTQVQSVPRESWHEHSVRDVMTTIEQGLTVTRDEPMSSVLEKLRRSPVQRLLVIHDGRLEGLITPRDVAAWLERVRLVAT